ncbi:hypothetical protein [Krasilnikovia sp. MM14-A1004]|uniref:hypothetical protein n=1 Tax=Krasilnikovia sp. MM14-A1004 TaxID=3373541 RepID=UPI00399D4AE8
MTGLIQRERDRCRAGRRRRGRGDRDWGARAPESRPLDDEALAHDYLGTAHLLLGDLDAATTAIRPILDLPADRQISWIKKRLGRFAGMLRTEPYTGSPAADDLYDEIRALAA